MNNKENLKKILKIKNIKNHLNKEILFRKNNFLKNKSPDCINIQNNFNFLTLSPENNIIKTIKSLNNFHTIIPINNNNENKKNRKKIPNLIFPKKEIKGIQILDLKIFIIQFQIQEKLQIMKRIIFNES